MDGAISSGIEYGFRETQGEAMDERVKAMLVAILAFGCLLASPRAES